jgi:hypothetical protein
MSDLIKRCRCGHENLENESFCLQCGQPILEVEPVPRGAPRPPAPATSPPPAGQKRCSHCGTWNDAYAMLCVGERCGQPFASDTLCTETRRGDEPAGTPPATSPADATPDAGIRGAPPEVTLRESTLSLIVGAAEYECREGDVLGREGTVARQVFSEVKTVSRRHVSVSKRDGQWRVAIMPGVVNKTLLDGRELTALGAALTGDHTLQMSSQCQVKLRVVL